jgi:hypothetical protein
MPLTVQRKRRIMAPEVRMKDGRDKTFGLCLFPVNTVGPEEDAVSNIIYTPFLNYLRIAVDAQDKMVRYVQEHETTSLGSDDFQNTADGQATVVVLYTAIALECYIFNYAARKLGENFCKKHVESMGHQTKWLLVPKLATGKAIPSDHRAIVLLQKLIAARNDVVHAKAVNISPERWEEQKERIAALNRSILDAALNAFRCVGELGSALSTVDPEEPSAKLLTEFLKLPMLSLQVKAKPAGRQTKCR